MEREEMMQNLRNSEGTIHALDEKENVFNEKWNQLYSYRRGGTVLRMILGIMVSGVLASKFTDVSEVLEVIVFVCGVVASWLWTRRVIANKQRKLDILQSELNELRNAPELAWLPDSYRNLRSYTMIKKYTNDQRVSNLKEALNLLELERHQAILEYGAILGGLRNR